MGTVKPTRRTPTQPASVHRLKVTLLGFRPPIWRRILVPSNITLGALHDVLQDAMGWSDSHLHDFRVGRDSFGDPSVLDDLDGNEWETTLEQVAPQPKQRFRYLYDFGDSWEHEVLVEAVAPPEPGLRYPTCIGGKRACPPDDCGGVWGYADLLETLANPEDPEREDMLEWLGGPFDPEAFDLEVTNLRLARSH